MRTLLVTGGAGFIGSNFIHHVLGKHEDVRVVNLDKLTYAGNLQNLTDIEAQYGLSHHSSRVTDYSPRYFFVKGDICDRKLVNSLFSGEYFTHHPSLVAHDVSPVTHHPLRIDAVVNFAAESHVDRSMLDASPFVDANIKGTQVLLDAARTHWDCGSDSRRFIQISTDEVYGSLDKDGLFSEESPIRPNNPYSATKAAAELLCRAYHKAYGVPVIITRSSNNYGPYQFPEKLIPLMIWNAMAGKALPVYGEGKQIRDWLYVEDNCRAIDVVLWNAKAGETYNIGGNCEKKNIDVVNLICSILEEKLGVSSSPITHHSSLYELIEFISDPRGGAHDYRYALDSSKIREELGWEPERAFEEGLKRVITWYLENQEWVENIITGEYQAHCEKIYRDSGNDEGAE
ncbi:dTDP-glucose 4,6-dehydratase [Candidatus Bipolaricaulota bacterium]